MKSFFLSTLAPVLLFSHSAPQSLALAASPAAEPALLVLKYFDIRGAAEASRVLLAIGGEDYEDSRYPIDAATLASPAFSRAKESGELSANLDRAPVLVTPGGVAIGQSRAIERYLSRRFGLMGRTPEEEAIVDCIAEHCRDVKDAASRKGFSPYARDKTDREKARAREEWFSGDLPALLARLEDAVGAVSTREGCSVGSSVSYADVAIWALLRDCPRSDAGDTLAAAGGCTALNTIADAVAGHPGVSDWIARRPETVF
eukprot:CAMPEP_0201185844 /NCGR_PEP_ID=MMETSP0851-20130426/129838_1 /ASSEMBLY_ACC=CAM_ASM_000631 /TAXON_ID=183588 /ORGANISM="Pseudo-nitzschia fraudulenta, Strain WWA7" /LENGTH=258 /DNA_ID=CAMNT_0047471069 /DNA_START=51 /DNA_END=827 /DNA_ORIENTATION=+